MARTRKNNSSNGNGKTFVTQQSLDSAVWSICNILRRSNCAGALQYVPERGFCLAHPRRAQTQEVIRRRLAPLTPRPAVSLAGLGAPGGSKRVEL
jgi:type I restriction enzyme M protein